MTCPHAPMGMKDSDTCFCVILNAVDNTWLSKGRSPLKQSIHTPPSSGEGKLWVSLFQNHLLLTPHPLLKKKLCVCEGWNMCAWVKLSACNSRGLELQAGVTCPMWALGTKLLYYAKTSHAVDCWDMSPVPLNPLLSSNKLTVYDCFLI